MTTHTYGTYRYTPLYVRFWNNVRKTDTCWLWTGATTKFGHGVVICKGTKRRGATQKAHRISWLLHFGPVPDGMFVCHTCDVPACVNPDHLYVGTAKDNTRDCLVRGRIDRVKRPRGEKHGNSKLNADIVRDIRARREQGETLRAIAERHNTPIANVCQIVKRRAWAHVQ
jgi:hypothetical protein